MPRPVRIRLLLLLVAFCLPLLACGPSGPRSAYPPPETLRMADDQRHEFIQLFLQGRWCEAQGMFARSQESYLLQDDFCSAAQNHLIAWKLKQYLNISADQHLEKAENLSRTGLHCPGTNLPQDTVSPPDAAVFSAKDQEYRVLLTQQDFQALFRKLRDEPDPLHASVYGRKAALTALDSGNMEPARELIQLTRELDARQGWIVFLIQDWKIIHELTDMPLVRADILERIDRLYELIQPCRF